jgi:hypothetical protein
MPTEKKTAKERVLNLIMGFFIQLSDPIPSANYASKMITLTMSLQFNAFTS